MAPTGYWGNVTSTLDWCEENYVLSPYMAEFWNTWSNLVMIVPPLCLAMICWHHGIEKHVLCCNIGVTVIGIGSWMFHMTLLYSMQLLDELPMLYTSACLVYAYVEIESPLHKPNRLLQLFLVVYCFVVTSMYLFNQNPIFHQVAYGLMVTSMAAACFNAVRRRYKELNVWIAFMSLAIYLSGFAAWNVDNIFCHQIREMRVRRLGMFGFVSQFHAWWHILAGFGTYLTLVFIMDSRYRLVKLSDKRPITKYWLSFFPYATLEHVP